MTVPRVIGGPGASPRNNAWGMVPSPGCVPGDLDNHGGYHSCFPLFLLLSAQTPIAQPPSRLGISLTPCNIHNTYARRSGGLRLFLAGSLDFPDKYG
jgi:hypothetical protein